MSRMLRVLAYLVSTIGVLVILSLPVRAQVSTSGITGTVTDPSGALIPNAKVTATDEATGVHQATQTTSAGLFSFPSMAPGAYTIEIEATGFDRYVGKGNILTVGQPLVVNVKLQVGSTATTVEVQGNYERLQTTNATLGDVIDRRAIQNLPLNGRNPLNLIALEPGLVQRSNGGAGSGTHVNGSRDRAFNVTLDGIDINEPSVPNPQSNVFRLNTDNVQEYRVITQDPTPEYGRNSGANVSIVSRSGANDFHGTVYDYFRNPSLNANEWFANGSGLPRDQLRLNQYGADVGGPIIKDKTFFFASWEGQRLSDSASIANALGAVPSVYTSAVRRGIFRYVAGTVTASNGKSFTANSPGMVDAQGNLLPGIVNCATPSATNCVASYNIFANDPSKIGEDSVMGKFINSEPLPNSFTHGDGLNFAGFQWSPGFHQPEARWLARVDEQFNDNNSMFVRYLIDFADTLGGDFLNGRPRVFPGFAPLGEVRRRPSNLAVTYRHVFSPQMVNEFTAGYGRFLFDFAFGRANPSFPNIPPFRPANITSPFLNQSGTARWLTTRQLVDNLTYTHAAHTIRAGINFRLVDHNDQRSFVGGVNNAPQVFFSGSGPGGRPPTASFNLPGNISSSDIGPLENSINEFLGIPSSETQAFFSSGLSGYTPSGLYVRGARLHQYDFYGQDEWKWRPNLTVTYGARYELNRPATEANNLILGPNQPFGNFSQTGPISFVSKKTFWDRDNALSIAPRIGIAWQPFADGKTVVRAGYGIAFDTVSTFELVPVLGLVPGSSAGCSLTISDGSSGPTPASNCAIPSGAGQRIAGGFPLTLPQPSLPPSAFATPPVARSSLAPFAGGVDPNLKNPAVYEWDLSVEHDLGKKTVLEADYVGKRGTHLLRAYNLNQLKLNHDGFLQDFGIARSNLLQCGDPNGTSGCGQTVPLLPGLFGGTIPTTGGNGKSVSTDLQFNAAGALAALIDSDKNFFPSMVSFTGKPDFFRPNPQFGQVFWLDSGGDSYYHALQLQVRRHETSVDFGGAYTFAKSIDDMSVDPVGATSGGAVGNNSRTPTDIYDFRIDRGRSDFDRTQVFTGYVVWNLPVGRGQRWASQAGGALNQLIGGWSASAIVTAMSGEPFSVLSGRFTNSNIRTSRANIVGSTPPTGLFFNGAGVAGPLAFNFAQGSYIVNKTDPNLGCLPMQNGSFFCTPPPGSDGTQGRNIFNGPKFTNLDISLSKQFPLTERWKLQFRSDFFNAFNHPNFDNPLNSTDGSESITSGGFGQACCVAVSVPSSTSVVSVGEAYRVIQFALRLSF